MAKKRKASKKIDWTAIPVSSNSQVTSRRLYRTLVGQQGVIVEFLRDDTPFKKGQQVCLPRPQAEKFVERQGIAKYAYAEAAPEPEKAEE